MWDLVRCDLAGDWSRDLSFLRKGFGDFRYRMFYCDIVISVTCSELWDGAVPRSHQLLFCVDLRLPLGVPPPRDDCGLLVLITRLGFLYGKTCTEAEMDLESSPLGSLYFFEFMAPLD